MGHKLIIALVIILTSTSISNALDSPSKMQSWWDDTRNHRQQQQQQVQMVEVNQCELDLQRWNEKLTKEPNSLYYQYKREQATKRCQQELTP